MKKLLEWSDDDTVTVGYDGLGVEDGLVDAVRVDFIADREYASLLDNAVKLEKGQEAIFKVTVTTTVELIDVRMAEPQAPITALCKHGLDAPGACDCWPLTEHADGCSFFYGNKCECGFDDPKHIGHINQPLTPEQKNKLADIIPTTQTKPKPSVCHCGWEPARCGLPMKDWPRNDTWTHKVPLVTCPDCLKALQPKTEEPWEYEWWCQVCGRIEKINGKPTYWVNRKASCITCRGAKTHPLDTMIIRAAPRPA